MLRQRTPPEAMKLSVVGVLAALVLGEIAHAFQLRKFVQQLLLDTLFQGYIHH